MIVLEVYSKDDTYYGVRDIIPFDKRYHHLGKAFIRTDNSDLANSLYEELKRGMEVLILKSEVENKWLKEPLKPESIKVVEVDHLDKVKLAARMEISTIFSGSFEQLSTINLFSFICSTLKLMDAGYYITEKNREEKYLEIIQTDDDDLIETLKEFLDVRDNVVAYQLQQYDAYKKGIKAINKAETEEEVNEVMKEFRHALDND